MAERTGIAWCDHTFNIAWGCAEVSPGCAHCYARQQAERFGFNVWAPRTERRTFGVKHWEAPLKWNDAAKREGVKRRVFSSSMADIWEDHPVIDHERQKLWPLIRATPWLDWLLLTKRPERICGRLPEDWGDGYHNVWLGTSVENQRYDYRAFLLSEIPAVLRFVSAEPLLGPLDLTRVNPFMHPDHRKKRIHGASLVNTLGVHGGIHWVIAGGESQPGARPLDNAWLRKLRDDCSANGAAFFLKQLGGHPNPHAHHEALLDGRTHVEFPAVRIPLL